MTAVRDLSLYLIITGTALAGMLSLSWWAAVLGGCALALKLMSEEGWARGRHDTVIDAAQAAANLAIALVATPIAYLGGRLIAAAWGLSV